MTGIYYERAAQSEMLAMARRSARLLAAAKEALRVLDSFSLDDLMEGKDAPIRAELISAIRDLDPEFSP
jgi:hypothetical protein